MKPNLLFAVVCAFVLMIATTYAHDTWLQTPSSIVRVGEPAHVDLLLGNHGNEHRDFKIAGKVKAEDVTLTLTAPSGTTTNLQPQLIDNGLTAKDGWLSARFTPEQPGLYAITLTSDKVVDYAPKRSVKTAKAYVLATPSLDRPTVPSNANYDTPVGHGLEIVPLNSPVAPLSVGERIKVKLLLQGKPLADQVISFIPRGAKLKEGFDERYEAKTNAEGVVSFEFHEANVFLIAAHYEEKSDGSDPKYDAIKYSATLTVHIPATCSCCGE